MSRDAETKGVGGYTPIDGDMSINDNILTQFYIALSQEILTDFDTNVQHNIETIDAANQVLEYLLENRIVTGPNDAGGDDG